MRRSNWPDSIPPPGNPGDITFFHPAIFHHFQICSPPGRTYKACKDQNIDIFWFIYKLNILMLEMNVT